MASFTLPIFKRRLTKKQMEAREWIMRGIRAKEPTEWQIHKNAAGLTNKEARLYFAATLRSMAENQDMQPEDPVYRERRIASMNERAAQLEREY